MSYFTIKRSFWLVSSNSCDEEFKKTDKFNIYNYIIILKKQRKKGYGNLFNFPTAPFIKVR